MSYEEFEKAVKAEAVKMFMSAHDEETSKALAEDAWNEYCDGTDGKPFMDQFDDLKLTEKRFADGEISEKVYKGRIQSAIGTAAWNVWMLA